MSEGTLHPMPRWRDVVLEQIRVVGVILRPAALVLGMVLGIGTVMVAGEILGGGRGFDGDETFPTPLIFLLFPFAVWRGERRFGPSFLATLPVDRRQLALAKVFAGFVWMMIALAIFAAWLLTLGLIAGAELEHTIERLPFIVTIFAYLIGSAVVVGLRYPIRWLCGAAGVFFLLGAIGDAVSRPDDGEWRYVPFAHQFFAAVEDAAATWESLPAIAQTSIAAVLFLGAGCIALWAAASRHKENR